MAKFLAKKNKEMRMDNGGNFKVMNAVVWTFTKYTLLNPIRQKCVSFVTRVNGTRNALTFLTNYTGKKQPESHRHGPRDDIKIGLTDVGLNEVSPIYKYLENLPSFTALP